MTAKFVSDGPARFENSKEFQARCRELRAQVHLQFAGAFVAAGFFRRIVLRWQRHRAYQQAVAEVTPSDQCLWLATVFPPRKEKPPARRA